MSGPDPNALCIFPFEYNGEIFNECTDKEHDQMWCHTSEDWGNCGPDCTTSSGTPSSGTPSSGTSNASSFYRSKKCLWLVQIFCARPKIDLRIVKMISIP